MLKGDSFSLNLEMISVSGDSFSVSGESILLNRQHFHAHP